MEQMRCFTHGRAVIDERVIDVEENDHCQRLGSEGQDSRSLEAFVTGSGPTVAESSTQIRRVQIEGGRP